MQSKIMLTERQYDALNILYNYGILQKLVEEGNVKIRSNTHLSENEGRRGGMIVEWMDGLLGDVLGHGLNRAHVKSTAPWMGRSRSRLTYKLKDDHQVKQLERIYISYLTDNYEVLKSGPVKIDLPAEGIFVEDDESVLQRAARNIAKSYKKDKYVSSGNREIKRRKKKGSGIGKDSNVAEGKGLFFTMRLDDLNSKIKENSKLVKVGSPIAAVSYFFTGFLVKSMIDQRIKTSILERKYHSKLDHASTEALGKMKDVARMKFGESKDIKFGESVVHIYKDERICEGTSDGSNYYKECSTVYEKVGSIHLKDEGELRSAISNPFEIATDSTRMSNTQHPPVAELVTSVVDKNTNNVLGEVVFTFPGLNVKEKSGGFNINSIFNDVFDHRNNFIQAASELAELEQILAVVSLPSLAITFGFGRVVRDRIRYHNSLKKLKGLRNSI